MISLICTHCQTALSIDDAFAGGVCRCQHCGTIQTVPSKRSGDSAVGAAQSSSGRTLYQTQSREGRPVGMGSGLDDLAEVVASSGLGNTLGNSTGSGLAGSGLAGSGAGSGLARGRRGGNGVVGAAAQRSPSRTPWMIGLFAIGIVLLAVVAYFVGRAGVAAKPPAAPGGSPNASEDVSGGASTGGPGGPAGSTPASIGPQFCGMPLSGSSIVYLLDRGDSASDVFDALKQVTYASIASLGPDRKFQLLLWDNHTDDTAYPPDGTTYATPANLTACEKAMDDVIALHQSTIDGPLKKAVAEHPDSIVIVTAKGFELDESFAADVNSIIKGSSIKLDTVSLRGTDCPALRTLANDTGGTYRAISDGALRAALPQ